MIEDQIESRLNRLKNLELESKLKEIESKRLNRSHRYVRVNAYTLVLAKNSISKEEVILHYNKKYVNSYLQKD